MHILDKQGNRHKVDIGRVISVDHHTIATMQQSDSKALIHGFQLPAGMQGMGIGSVLLKHLEDACRRKHVSTMEIVVNDETCPVHHQFWSKHGYRQDGRSWTKHI